MNQRSNDALNLTVRPVTRLAGLHLGRTSTGRAQGARPSRPAGYARRYAAYFENDFVNQRRRLNRSCAQELTIDGA